MTYNLVLVFDKDEKRVLMCFRSKNPYKGKYNLLGGKIENGEDYLESAYRELFEESGITAEDITLEPFMDFAWHPINMEMKVFSGVLKHDVQLVDEVHELFWIDIEENFFDYEKFAGEGNIGHMIKLCHDWKK
ncbi:hypothetical protein KQ51_00654 [Candidatus Izimaplasma bacterium HR1]|nr:hypothetical protein KQ51_00654 [Candidatus Izimaplasma bacterium HR1]